MKHKALIFRNFTAFLGAAYLVLVFTACSARADEVTYTYTGNALNAFGGDYSCSNGVGECGISGSFTVGTALADNLTDTPIDVTSFSFTDGNTIWTNANAGTIGFYVGTDSSGDITHWGFSLWIDGSSTDDVLSSEDTPLFVYDYSDMYPAAGGLAAGVAGNTSDPGVWVEGSTAVPEPGTPLLLATGLLGLAGIFWSRTRQPAELRD